MNVVLTLTEEQAERLGYALLLAERHHHTNWEAASPGHYKDDYRIKLNGVRELRTLLDQAPVIAHPPCTPLATWSDHDRNIPADEQDEGGAL